jgi:hypothetical protein
MHVPLLPWIILNSVFIFNEFNVYDEVAAFQLNSNIIHNNHGILFQSQHPQSLSQSQSKSSSLQVEPTPLEQLVTKPSKSLFDKCKGYCLTISISSLLTLGCTFSSLGGDNINVANAFTTLNYDQISSFPTTSTRLHDKQEEEQKLNINADITDIANNIGGLNLNSIRESLVPASDDRPQIKLPENSINSNPSLTTQPPPLSSNSIYTTPTTANKNNDKSPIMEGMVYLLNNNIRPELNDNIILTISSTSNPDTVLAGAKYNVYKAKYPFNFRMFDANIIKGKEEIWREIDRDGGGDYIVTARVCPEESRSLPCSDEESTFYARSVSKLLKLDNLPGANEGDIVRTAVSLPLKPQ